MSSTLKTGRSVPELQTEYVDSDGNIVDLSEAIWMIKVVLPYIDIQEIYQKIQDEVMFQPCFPRTILVAFSFTQTVEIFQVVLSVLPRGTKSLLRVNCTNDALQ